MSGSLPGRSPLRSSTPRPRAGPREPLGRTTTVYCTKYTIEFIERIWRLRLRYSVASRFYRAGCGASAAVASLQGTVASLQAALVTLQAAPGSSGFQAKGLWTGGTGQHYALPLPQSAKYSRAAHKARDKTAANRFSSNRKRLGQQGRGAAQRRRCREDVRLLAPPLPPVGSVT